MKLYFISLKYYFLTENVIKDLGDLNIEVKCLNLIQTSSVLMRCVDDYYNSYKNC